MRISLWRPTVVVAITALLAILGAALLAPSAGARIYRDGSFHIKAPGGWKLKRTGKGGHVLSCGSAKVGFARGKAKKKTKRANVVGNALVKEIGLVAQSASGNKKKFKATIGGMRGDVLRQGGVAVKRKGRVISVRAWAVDAGSSGECSGRALRKGANSSALIDELAGIANSAAGGRIRDIRIKQIEFLANPPIPLRRYEVCSQAAQQGTPPCSSALVPVDWFPNIFASPGQMEGVGAVGNQFRGQFTLGGVANIWRPVCGPTNPYGGPVREFTGDTDDIAQNVWPGQQAFAGQLNPIFTPLANVQILAVLRNPWVQGLPSKLYLLRWTQDGRAWSALFGAAVVYFDPSSCLWAWYFSYVAAPDNGVPGTATALLQTWASWRLSYDPITQRPVRPLARASGLPSRVAHQGRATASAGGDTEAPQAAGTFEPRKEKAKLPDLRDIAP